MSEKKRGANFSDQDIQILLKMCNKYKKIIECKKTDAITNKEKESAWEKIKRDFQAHSMDSSRTIKQLQEKYKAIKKKMKTDYSKNLQYLRGTGGGPHLPPPTPKTEEEKELLETIRLSVEGLSNPFDNDGTSGFQGIMPQSLQLQEKYDSEDDDDAMIDVDWTSGSSQLWQTPKHPALKMSRSKEVALQDINRSYKLTDDSDTDGTANPRQKSKDPAAKELQENKAVSLPRPIIVLKAEQEQNKENMVELEIPTNKDEHNNANEKSSAKRKWQNRRRPVLPKKRVMSSAAAKFEAAAEKKIELIEYQKLAAETILQQSKQQHQEKMEILQIQKNKEMLKYQLLEQGTLTFQF